MAATPGDEDQRRKANTLPEIGLSGDEEQREARIRSAKARPVNSDPLHVTTLMMPPGRMHHDSEGDADADRWRREREEHDRAQENRGQ